MRQRSCFRTSRDRPGTKGILASKMQAGKPLPPLLRHRWMTWLFAATDAHAQAVRDKIAAAVGDESPRFRAQLTSRSGDHVLNADGTRGSCTTRHGALNLRSARS